MGMGMGIILTQYNVGHSLGVYAGQLVPLRPVGGVAASSQSVGRFHRVSVGNR